MPVSDPKFDVNTELAARRTGMSFQRTRMSADRTLMSVIRTALSLISFGFTIFQVFQKLREQSVINLRTDPYERADQTSNTYYDWFIHRPYILYGAWHVMDLWAATFKDFPPVQHPNSFTIDEALKMLSEAEPHSTKR